MPPAPLMHLGDLPVERFMRRYWQRQPVLIRNAVPMNAPTFSLTRLAALAAREDVESRLVTAFGGKWRLRHGPFAQRQLPSRARSHWTLLVQGVDLHDDAGADLLARFRFLPASRLDDLMVSYASDGGGVGPHVDSYDAFLLQAHGRRRWRIGPAHDAALVSDLPLKVLARFSPTQEWLLNPGDCLYLPPGVAHEGVAIGGDCVTASIGARAPAWQEFVDPWLTRLTERLELSGRYADRGAPPTRRPALLPAAYVDAALSALGRIRPTRPDAEHVLLAALTEPARLVVFDRPSRPLALARFAALVRERGVRTDRRTRMLYSGQRAAINGEVLHWTAADRKLLRALADRCFLAARSMSEASDDTIRLLHEWYRNGWLHIG